MRRQYRLRHRDDFKRSRTEGKTWRNQLLILSVMPGQQTVNRYGFVVSKRQGNAVKRNKLRRRLRAIMTEFHAVLKFPHDVVIIARQPSGTADFWVLRASLVDLLYNAGLLEQESL